MHKFPIDPKVIKSSQPDYKPCSREITKVSSELLFEVWDQAGESDLFLGLTIGSIVYKQYYPNILPSLSIRADDHS